MEYVLDVESLSELSRQKAEKDGFTAKTYASARLICPLAQRTMADQATKLYTDGNMNEMKREEYIKTHGFDPEPVMDAVNKWREEQIMQWAASMGKSGDEVDQWIRRISKKLP